MPGPLKRFTSDPNKKGRKAGYYYHRGHGEYSRYKVGRDKDYKQNKPRGVKRKRKGTHDTDPGNWGMDAAVGSYIHTHDYNSPHTARRARSEFGDIHKEWNPKKTGDSFQKVTKGITKGYTKTKRRS